MAQAEDAIAGGTRVRSAASAGAVVLVVAGLVAALLLLLGDDGDAAAELDQAFARPIDSADVRVDVELRVDGSPQLPTPLRLRVAGPYRSGASRTIPSLDWNVSFVGSGRNVSTRLVSTGRNAFVVFQEVAYEVGEAEVADTNRRIAAGQTAARPPTLSDLGIRPRGWLIEPEDRGEEELAGAPVTRYSAGIDVTRLLDDLTRAAERLAPRVGRAPPPRLNGAQRDQVRRVVPSATLDAFVGADGRVRRLAVLAPFTVPPENRARAGGATGGLAAISLDLSRLDRPNRIVAPPDVRPIEDLRRQIGPLPPAAP